MDMGKVTDTHENMVKCICGDCPSKPGDDMGLYCAKGKSPKTVRRRGCVCGDCAVLREYGLTKGYYCDEGVTE
jgi:aldose sugar dehydrogenase